MLLQGGLGKEGLAGGWEVGRGLVRFFFDTAVWMPLSSVGLEKPGTRVEGGRGGAPGCGSRCGVEGE